MTGVSQIVRTIPHRYPILLVDRVVSVVPGERITAVKAVTCTEPCYADVPESAGTDGYAYPASLLIESWGQTGVLLAVWQRPNPNVLSGKVELAGGARDIEFVRPVYPGSVLHHHAWIVREVGETAVLAGETLCDGEPVMRVGQFIVTLRPAEVLRPLAVPALRA